MSGEPPPRRPVDARLEDEFGRLIEQPSTARAHALEALRREDAQLAAELARLLEAHEADHPLLDELAERVERTAPLELERAAGLRLQIGPYRLREVLGRGGMGVVYRATRVEGGFEQEVALKLLHLDMDSPDLRARFAREQQLLARLDHPGIARLLDGGVTHEERPFIVMELVEGAQAIDRHCAQRRLSVRQIVELMLEVLAAVAFLHRNLVVHRDLKPSNILVDSRGRPRLVDFGIAKLLDVEDAYPATRTAQLVLTPGYASPEQTRGDPVTPATDVYTLGLLLDQLLTGRRPSIQASSAPEISSRTPPSAERERRSRDHLAEVPPESVPRDLDLVVLKALHPEPNHRYASAQEMRRDLAAFLAGRPVEAAPDSRWYRASKWLRRHWRGAALVSFALILALAGGVREVLLRRSAEAERERASRAAAEATAVSDFLVELLSSANPANDLGRDLSVLDVVEDAAEKLGVEDRFRDQPLVEATLRQTIGATLAALGRARDGLPHVERAVVLRRQHGASRSEILDALRTLGRVHYELSENDRAAEIFRQVVDQRSELLGEDHPATLEALSDLASTLWQQARYTEVEALDRQLLARHRRVLGNEHPDTAAAMNGLAATLFTTNRISEAAELFAESYRVQRRIRGASHPSTLMAGNNLGSAWLELGSYQQAAEVLEEVLELRRSVHGEHNVHVAMTLHNLGLVRARLGRLEEAAELLQLAAEMRSLTGDTLGRTAETHIELAGVQSELARFEEAEQSVERAHQLAEQIADPPPDLHVALGMASVDLELRRGNSTEAQRLHARLERSVAELAPDASEHLEFALLQSRLSSATGRHAEALEIVDEVARAAEKEFGAEHPLTLDVQLEVARGHTALGDHHRASALARVLLPRLLALYPANHPKVTEARALLDSAPEATTND